MLKEMLDSDQQLDGIVRALFALDSGMARQVADNFHVRQRLCHKAEADSDAAYKGDQDKLKSIHHALTLIYEREFSIPSPEQTSFHLSGLMRDIASIIETFLLDYEEQFISPAIFDDIPENGEQYIRWLRKLIHNHKASKHPFYEEFIRYKANRADLKYYLVQETTLDPRFDDSLALLQLGTRGQVKMEMANNYWDEMGNGDFRNVHTALFARALDDLGVTPEYIQGNLTLGAEISGNLSACLVLYRRHFYKAIGYFGVTEYLVPRRFKHIVFAWQRNELPPAGIIYHDLHIGVDAGHANGWFYNVIVPILKEHHAAGKEIARGALMRLNSSGRYLDQIYQHLATPS